MSIRKALREGLDQAEAIADVAPAIRRNLDSRERAEVMARGVDVKPMDYLDQEPEIARHLFGDSAGFIRSVALQSDKSSAFGGTVLSAWANRCVERGLVGYSGVGGGFLAPELVAEDLWSRIRSVDGPLSRCRHFYGDANVPGSRNKVSVPCIDDETIRTTDGVAGFRLILENETDNSASTPIGSDSFGRVVFEPRRAIFYAQASDDLVADAPLLGQALDTLSVEGMRAGLENLMIQGTGVGQPWGVINAPGTVNVARASGGQITVADIKKMRRSLWPYCWRAAPIWHVLAECVEVLEELVDAAGNALYKQQGQGPNGPYPATLMGWPVLPHESCSPLGTAGDLLLACWSEYGHYSVGYPARTPGGPATPIMRMSKHALFSTDQVVFRWVLGVDGMPMWKAPVKPARATDANLRQSPFVCLN